MVNYNKQSLLSKGYIGSCLLTIIGIMISQFPDKINFIPESFAEPILWVCVAGLVITILLWIKDCFKQPDKTKPTMPKAISIGGDLKDSRIEDNITGKGTQLLEVGGSAENTIIRNNKEIAE